MASRPGLNLHREIRKAWEHCVGAFRGVFSGGRETREKDSQRVARAARLLQISDFRFFQLSYLRWHGRSVPEAEMEPIFSDYLLREEVPFWARHLARQVHSLYARDALEPGDFGIELPPLPRERRSCKILCGLLLTAIYFLFFIVLSGYASYR
jgi:hypothetical protein